LELKNITVNEKPKDRLKGRYDTAKERLLSRKKT
jgi:hypothetical protein